MLVNINCDDNEVFLLHYYYYRGSLGAFRKLEVLILLSAKCSLLDTTVVSQMLTIMNIVVFLYLKIMIVLYPFLLLYHSLSPSPSPSLLSFILSCVSPSVPLGTVGTNEETCERVGCCWDPKDVSKV